MAKWTPKEKQAREELARIEAAIDELVDQEVALAEVDQSRFGMAEAGESHRQQHNQDVELVRARRARLERQHMSALDRLRAEEFERKYEVSERRSWIAVTISIVLALLNAYGLWGPKKQPIEIRCVVPAAATTPAP